MGIQSPLLGVRFAFILGLACGMAFTGCTAGDKGSSVISAQVAGDHDGADDDQDEPTSKLDLSGIEKETLLEELKNDDSLNAVVVEPQTIDDVLSYFPFTRIVSAKVTTQTSGKVDIEFLDAGGAKVKTPKTFLGMAAKGFVADGILILNLKTKVKRVYVTVFIDLNNGNKVSSLRGSGLIVVGVETIPTGVPILCKALNEEYQAVDCQILRESGKVIAREIK